MNITSPNRACPECGVAFVAHHGRQRFCTPAHQTRFHDLMSQRGKVAMPLAQTWRLGKRASGAAAASYSLVNLCALMDRWNAEDKAAGRNPALVVADKMTAQWNAADLAS